MTTDQWDAAALLAVYSAMAVYTLAFVAFAIDIAKRSAAKTAVAKELVNARSRATIPQSTQELVDSAGRAARIGYVLTVLGWVVRRRHRAVRRRRRTSYIHARVTRGWCGTRSA